MQYRRSATGNGTTNGAAAWSGTQAYVIGDTVTYNAYVWLCVEANTNHTPGTLDGSGNPYWTILVTTVQPEAPPWTEAGLQTPGRLVHVEPVTPGAIYDVRIRYELTDGSVTQWATLAAHQVAGQITLPPDIDPTTLTATNLGGGSIQLRWTPVSWPNLADYEVRQGSTWASGTLTWRGRSSASDALHRTRRRLRWLTRSGSAYSTPQATTIRRRRRCRSVCDRGLAPSDSVRWQRPHPPSGLLRQAALRPLPVRACGRSRVRGFGPQTRER